MKPRRVRSESFLLVEDALGVSIRRSSVRPHLRKIIRHAEMSWRSASRSLLDPVRPVLSGESVMEVSIPGMCTCPTALLGDSERLTAVGLAMPTKARNRHQLAGRKPISPMRPRHPPERQDEEVVTLGDIADFDTRQNVATLMAVAPGLAVRDLYHLLIDMKGDMPAAREQATIRASCAPPSRPFVKREQTPAVPAPQNVVDLADSDSDDVMIKIDPNAPFLEYNTDTPPPEESIRAKKPAAARKRRAQPNSARKRTKGVAVRHHRYRENSINDFVVGNGTVHYETDRSSSTDSESEASDVPNGDDSDQEMLEPENLEDLRIDLRSKYACNAHILGQKRKTG
jgi:hypothetical protein